MNMMNCNICGSEQFLAGPNGRLATTNAPPCCARCGSLERQRIVRRVFQAFPLGLLDHRRARQYGDAICVDKKWFRSFEPVDSTDALGLGSASHPPGAPMAYDLIALNHLLEFIADDRAALTALRAQLSPRGILQLGFSGTATRAHGVDFAPAQADTGVFHLYGRDVLEHFSDILSGMTALVVEQTDPCTEVREVLHFVFMCRRDAEDALRWLTLEGSATLELRDIVGPAPAPAFAPLAAELALWQAAGLTCRFWWRDDDLVSMSPLLQQLADMSHRFKVSVLVAVIPAQADANLAHATTAMQSLVFCQHGYDHVNHEDKGEPSSEFGAGRGLDALKVDLERGQARMRALFGARFFPVFVPPWNRIASAAVPLLEQVHFIGLSQYADMERHTATSLQVADTHVDIIQWSAAPDTHCRPVADLVERIVYVLKKQRLQDNALGEPIGLLTHHRVMRSDSWDFVHALLTLTRSFDCVQWLTPQQIFTHPTGASAQPT